VSIRFIRDWKEARRIGSRMIDLCLENGWAYRRAISGIPRENRSEEMIRLANDVGYKEEALKREKVLELATKAEVKLLVDKKEWENELLGRRPAYGYVEILPASLRCQQVDLILKNLENLPNYQLAYTLEPIDLSYTIAGKKELQVYTSLRSFREESYVNSQGSEKRSRGTVIIYFQDEPSTIKAFIEEFEQTFHDPTRSISNNEKVGEWLEHTRKLI
jgi:hypothetical protein